jgi:hypothetical protein
MKEKRDRAMMGPLYPVAFSPTIFASSRQGHFHDELWLILNESEVCQPCYFKDCQRHGNLVLVPEAPPRIAFGDDSDGSFRLVSLASFHSEETLLMTRREDLYRSETAISWEDGSSRFLTERFNCEERPGAEHSDDQVGDEDRPEGSVSRVS